MGDVVPPRVPLMTARNVVDRGRPHTGPRHSLRRGPSSGGDVRPSARADPFHFHRDLGAIRPSTRPRRPAGWSMEGTRPAVGLGSGPSPSRSSPSAAWPLPPQGRLNGTRTDRARTDRLALRGSVGSTVSDRSRALCKEHDRRRGGRSSRPPRATVAPFGPARFLRSSSPRWPRDQRQPNGAIARRSVPGDWEAPARPHLGSPERLTVPRATAGSKVLAVTACHGPFVLMYQSEQTAHSDREDSRRCLPWQARR